LLFYGNISMSKTKYTNNARLPEIIGAFGLITVYKNLRSFGSPKRHLHKIRGKDTTKNWNMQTLFYNFDIFLQIFSYLAQKWRTMHQNNSLQALIPAGYDFPPQNARAQKARDMRSKGRTAKHSLVSLSTKNS